MKRKTFSLFLVLALLIGIFPISAFAADDEYVLTSINHLSAVSVADVTGTHTAIFTVPYSFSGTVDFSNDLDITYDTDVYSSAIASFESGSTATVGGDPVVMTVTYLKENDTTPYTALYQLYVVRAAATAPAFTGTISKTITAPDVITFTDDDFTDLYHKYDGGALASIVITGSNPTFGSLKWGNSDYSFGTAVSLSELKAGILTFSANTAGAVSYTVKASAASDPSTQIGSVTLTITAAENDAGTVTYKTKQNTPIKLDAEDFSLAFDDATGNELDYVMLTQPSMSRGRLYYDYTSATEYGSVVHSDTEYYVSDSPALSNVTFAPASDYTGAVEISFTAYSIDGSSFTGNLIITVQPAEEEEESGHFADVGRGHIWAVEAIDYLYNEGIIAGDGKGHYNPSASISRGDFILMLCRAFHLSADSKGSFSDVEEGSYYSDAIATAKQLKIAKGSGGKFNPKASLSRQDAMVLIVRAMEAADLTVPAGDLDDLSVFSDSGKISDYAAEAVAALVRAGIIEGSNSKLNPKANVSRAEIAAILYRVLTD